MDRFSFQSAIVFHCLDFVSFAVASGAAKKRVNPQPRQTTTVNLADANQRPRPGSRLWLLSDAADGTSAWYSSRSLQLGQAEMRIEKLQIIDLLRDRSVDLLKITRRLAKPAPTGRQNALK